MTLTAVGHLQRKKYQMGFGIVFGIYVITSELGGLISSPTLTVVGHVFAFISIIGATLLFRGLLPTEIRKFPLSPIISFLSICILLGLVSRIMLILPGSDISPTLAIVCFGLFLYAYLRKDLLDSLQVIDVRKYGSLIRLITKEHLLLLPYFLLTGVILSSLLRSRSSLDTSIWSAMPTEMIFYYFAACGILVFILARGKISERWCHIIVIIHFILSFSILPIIFDPIFGTDGVWYSLSHAKAIELSLPLASHLYSAANFFDYSSIPNSMQILPRTLIVVFSQITGLDHLIVAAWTNPLLAGLALPAMGFLLADLMKLNQSARRISAILVLFIPSILYSLAVYWAMGTGLIIFGLGFVLILGWISTRIKGYLVLALLFSVGAVLTHPISATLLVIVLVLALGYEYLWVRSRYRDLFLDMLAIGPLVYPILPFILYRSPLTLGFNYADIPNALLSLVRIGPQTSWPQMALSLVFPIISILGVIAIKQQSQRENIIKFTIFLAIVLALTYLVNRLIFDSSPIPAGREISHLYLILLPLTIKGIVSLFQQTLRLNSTILRTTLISFCFALVITGNFLFAYPPGNKNGRVLPIELEAAKTIDETFAGRFGVITEFNNNFAGSSVYGIGNPDAFYLVILDYSNIKNVHTLVRSNVSAAITNFIQIRHDYLERINADQVDLDGIFVIESSYRYYSKPTYHDIVNILGNISLSNYRISDDNGNEVRVFQIYDRNLTSPQNETINERAVYYDRRRSTSDRLVG